MSVPSGWLLWLQLPVLWLRRAWRGVCRLWNRLFLDWDEVRDGDALDDDPPDDVPVTRRRFRRSRRP